MDEDKRNLIGSEKLDLFKRKHKDLPGSFYAADVDFAFIGKYPPGVVAYLDYKGSGEDITFSEVIAYNQLMMQAPVFIVEGSDPENGPFTIKRFLGGDFRPEPPLCQLEFVTTLGSWGEFEKWEQEIRKEYHEHKGWNGNLRKGTII